MRCHRGVCTSRSLDGTDCDPACVMDDVERQARSDEAPAYSEVYSERNQLGPFAGDVRHLRDAYTGTVEMQTYDGKEWRARR